MGTLFRVTAILNRFKSHYVHQYVLVSKRKRTWDNISGTQPEIVLDYNNTMSDNALPPKKHFYRRPLPQSCISFSSEEGKKLFKESLTSGHMESYFKLAAQFRTQDEPAFCGLSTMVMVLNALDIDPGRIWKGPWRWFHENMLDCCVPLDIVEQEGINFEQFLCLATCNSLQVEATRMKEGGMSLNTFREIVKEYSQQDDKFIVLSYTRRILDQTGDGHFSPIGGYNVKDDRVLILDTARFKYPPHWVKTELIYKAMQAVDKGTGQPRGLLLMSRAKYGQQLLLFRLSNSVNLTDPNQLNPIIHSFVVQLKQTLEKPQIIDADMNMLLEQSVTDMLGILLHLDNGVTILTKQLDFNCPKQVAKEQGCLVVQLLRALEKTDVFKKVIEKVNALSTENLNKLNSLFGISTVLPSCDAYCRTCCDDISCCHFLAFFLLSWPYALYISGDHNQAIQNAALYSEQLSSAGSDVLTQEVEALRQRLSVVVRVGIGLKDCSLRCQRQNAEKMMQL